MFWVLRFRLLCCLVGLLVVFRRDFLLGGGGIGLLFDSGVCFFMGGCYCGCLLVFSYVIIILAWIWIFYCVITLELLTV